MLLCRFINKGEIYRSMMKRLIVLLSLMFAISYGVQAETFFIYSYELCNGEKVPLEYRVKEGVLEGLFDTGHIVFDDVTDTNEEDLLQDGVRDLLFHMARKGGAFYLVGIKVSTDVSEGEGGKAYIKVTAQYFLFDLYTDRLINSGDLAFDNREREDTICKEELWSELGHSISEAIHSYYIRNIRKITLTEQKKQCGLHATEYY
jgi:hypothetical protein